MSADLTANSTYNFIVQDTDPSGNTNTNTNVALRSRSAASIRRASPGSCRTTNGPSGQQETVLTATFTAIATEANDPANGAAFYQVYLLNGGANACATGTLATEMPTSSYSAGTT